MTSGTPKHSATATLLHLRTHAVLVFAEDNHPPIASERLESAGIAALVVAGLYAVGACHQVCDEANHDGRKGASEGRIDGREDAEQRSEDVGTHGGSVLWS